MRAIMITAGYEIDKLVPREGDAKSLMSSPRYKDTAHNKNKARGTETFSKPIHVVIKTIINRM